jgi:serine/threonine-protein kinase
MQISKCALNIVQFALLGMFSLAPLNEASASCEYRCEGKGAFEDTCRSTCEDNERRQTELTDQMIESYRAGPATRFGAIAVSKSGAGYGTATGFSSQYAAEAAAIIYCEQNTEPGTCSVATWYWNKCGSLAMSSDGSWGADWASSRRSAAAKALNLCASAGGQDCEVKYAECEG